MDLLECLAEFLWPGRYDPPDWMLRLLKTVRLLAMIFAVLGLSAGLVGFVRFLLTGDSSCSDW